MDVTDGPIVKDEGEVDKVVDGWREVISCDFEVRTTKGIQLCFRRETRDLEKYLDRLTRS